MDHTTTDTQFDQLHRMTMQALDMARRMMDQRDALQSELNTIKAELAEARQTIEDLALGSTTDHPQHTD